MRRLTDYYPGKPISAKELNWLIEQVERLTNLSAAPPLELNGNQIRLVPGELWATITEPCDDGAHGWAEVQSNGDGTFSIVEGGRSGTADLNPGYEVNGNCADVDTIVRLYVGNFGEFLFQYCCATGSGSGGGLAQWYCLEEPSSGSGESGSGSGSGCDCVPYLCLEWAYIDGDGVLNFTGNGTPVTLTQEGCDGYFFENEYTGISFDGQTLVINAFDFGPGDGEYQGGSGWDCNSAYTVSPVYADPGFPATFILVPGVCGSGSGGAWYCLEEPSSGSGSGSSAAWYCLEEPSSGSGSGTVSADCCPDNLLPATLNVSIADAGGCSCLDGISFPIVWTGSDWQTVSDQPAPGCSNCVPDTECIRVFLSCTDEGGCYLSSGAPQPSCMNFCMLLQCPPGDGINYIAGTPVSCKCKPFQAVFEGVGPDDSCCPGGNIIVTVSA